MSIGGIETTPVLRVSGRTWAERIIAWPLCVAVLTVHLVLAHDDYPPAARAYAGLLCCLALLCIAYAPIRVVPALALALSYFYAALGAPVFAPGTTFSTFGPIRLPPTALEDATLAALFFAGTAIIVATVTDRATRNVAWSIARRLEAGSTYERRHTVVARAIAALSILVRIAITTHVKFGLVAQPVTLFASPIIATTLLFWDAEQTKRKSARSLFVAAVVLQSVVGLMSGMLSEALGAPVIAAALLWARRGRVPLGLIAAGVVTFLVLNPAKVNYRKITWFRNETTSMQQLTNWSDALAYTYFGSDNELMDSVENSLSSAAVRVNTLGQVAQMFDWVPERVPWAGPDRWLAVPSLLIPRLVWPDKPIQEEFFNRDYTYVFRLQKPGSAAVGSTSITLPSVGDGYWRVGWYGVGIEACVLGLLLGLAQAISRGGVSRIASRASLLLAMSLVQLHPEMHAFGLFNGALQQLLVGLIVAWLASWLADLLESPVPAHASGDRLTTSRSL